jgi:hypothetical protein
MVSEAKKAYMKEYWKEYRTRPEYIRRQQLRKAQSRKATSPEMIARKKASQAYQEAYQKAYAEEKAKQAPEIIHSCGLCGIPVSGKGFLCSECTPRYRYLQKRYGNARMSRSRSSRIPEYTSFSHAISSVATAMSRKKRGEYHGRTRISR